MTTYEPSWRLLSNFQLERDSASVCSSSLAWTAAQLSSGRWPEKSSQRSWHGSRFYSSSAIVEKSVEHIFTHCPFIEYIWESFSSQGKGLYGVRDFALLRNAWEADWEGSVRERGLPCNIVSCELFWECVDRK